MSRRLYAASTFALAASNSAWESVPSSSRAFRPLILDTTSPPGWAVTAFSDPSTAAKAPCAAEGAAAGGIVAAAAAVGPPSGHGGTTSSGFVSYDGGIANEEGAGDEEDGDDDALVGITTADDEEYYYYSDSAQAEAAFDAGETGPSSGAGSRSTVV